MQLETTNCHAPVARVKKFQYFHSLSLMHYFRVKYHNGSKTIPIFNFTAQNQNAVGKRTSDKFHLEDLSRRRQLILQIHLIEMNFHHPNPFFIFQ